MLSSKTRFSSWSYPLRIPVTAWRAGIENGNGAQIRRGLGAVQGAQDIRGWVPRRAGSADVGDIF